MAEQNLSPVSRTILSYKEEAEQAKRDRMDRNEENFSCFNLEQDFSEKKSGQSKEFLPKQATAIEQLTSFMSQGLMDNGDWFEVRDEDGVKRQPGEITADVMQKIMGRQLDKNSMGDFVSDSLKAGFLGSLIITKVGGKNIDVLKDVNVVEEEDLETGRSHKKIVRTLESVWQLDLQIVRQEDYYPDPTGRGLYEIERIEMDYHELLDLARKNPDIYDLKLVESLSNFGSEEDQKTKKARETGQNRTFQSIRRTIVLYECWGDIVDPETGEVIHRKSQSIITEDGRLVMPPRRITSWDQESPYVVAPIIRVPKSVWHRALADAVTRLNLAQNEMFNLMVDSSMMAVHGIKQIRESWLEDPSQVEEGIAPGSTLRVNDMAPPNGKVLERIDSSDPSSDATNMYNTIDREHNQSALSNDIRMGGLPERSVKATEIVASTQAINTILTGIVSVIEGNWMVRVLSKSAYRVAQNLDDYHLPEVENLLGERVALQIGGKDRSEIFREFAIGRTFNVFGLSKTLNKINDFRKYTTLLQTIGASPRLSDEFARRFSFTKMLGEIIDSLDIDPSKIEADEEETQRAQVMEQIRLQAEVAQGGGAQGQGQGELNEGQVPGAQNLSSEGQVSIPRPSLARGGGTEGGAANV